VQPTTVGSETSPSREGDTSFSIGTNEILGFAWLEEGFSFANSSVTCTYNAYFPISGHIDMQGGKLYLFRDLKLTDTVSFQTMGDIFGNNHFLDFSQSLTVFPSVSTSTAGAFTFIDDIVLGTTPNSVDWIVGDAHLAAGKNKGGGGGADELEGFSFDGAMLASVDVQTLGVNVNSVRWHPTADRLATGGDVKGGPSSGEIRIWEFNTTTEVFTEASSEDHSFSIKAVDWRPQGDYVAYGTTGDVEIHPVDGSGVLGAGIAADTNPTGVASNNALEWDDSGNYFAVGTVASAGTELLVYYFDGTSVTLTVSAELGADVLGLSWNPTGTFIAIGIDGGSETIRVYEHHVWDGTLIENTVARVGETVNINEVDWSHDGAYLAAGHASGTGNDVTIYSFDSGAVTLTEEFGADLSTGVNDVRWSRDDAYIAMALDNGEVEVYSFVAGAQSIVTSALFDSIHVFLNNDLDVEVTVTFQETCVVDGRGHTITLGSTGQLASLGDLTLKNVKIKDVNGNNVRCARSTDSIVFDKTNIVLSQDYSFTVGSLSFQRDVVISGTHVFALQSSSAATLATESELLIDRLVTLSYAPVTADQTLLVMTDSSSRLHFNNSSFFVTSTGVALTKGTLVLESEVVFDSDALFETEGIMWGDGADSTNDLRLVFFPDATLEVSSGFVLNKNVVG